MKRFSSLIFPISLLILLKCPTPACAEWHFQDSGTSETLKDVCFVDEMHGWAVGDSSTIIATSDGGETWVKQVCPIDSLILWKVSFLDQNVGYCICNSIIRPESQNGTILATTNGGVTWVNKEININLGRMRDMSFIDKDTGWVTCMDETNNIGIILHTEDGGNSWYSHETPMWFLGIDFIDRDTGWALGTQGVAYDPMGDISVFHTTDGGKEWIEVSNLHIIRSQIYTIFPDILWVCNGGLSLSHNGGINWITDMFKYKNDKPWRIYPIDGLRAYVLFLNGYEKVYRLRYTNDGGKTFNELSEFNFQYLLAISGIGEKHLWIVGTEGRIIKYTSVTTSVNEGNEDKRGLPETIKLKQNSPNPFNNTTTISFSLAKSDHVKLVVYDITGRKVAILLSDMLKSGYYSVMWDGKDSKNDSYISSGVYIYELSSGTFKERKKMLFMR